MKKILLVDASTRLGANSEVIVDTISKELYNHEVKVFNMREQNCQYCIACDACQHTPNLFCARDDDITELLPLLISVMQSLLQVLYMIIRCHEIAH